ncbi:hypothetical protein ACN2AU_00015 [Aerococcus viridans]
MPLKATDLIPVEDIHFSDFDLLVGYLKMNSTQNKSLELVNTFKNVDLKKKTTFISKEKNESSTKFEGIHLKNIPGAA